MKIPRFQNSGVPGAEQQSVGAIVQSGRARMNGSLNALNKVVQDFGERMLAEEQDAELHRLTRSMKQQAVELSDSIVQRDKVDANGDPTHDTMIADFEAGYKKLRENMNKRMKFRQNNNALMAQFDSIQDSITSSLQSEVRSRQVSIRKAEDVDTLDTYLIDTVSGWDDAQLYFDKMLAAERYETHEVESMRDKFYQQWFTNKSKTEFMQAMDQSLEAAQSFKDSMTYPENMTQAEIDSIDNYMGTRINNELNRIEREANKLEREQRAADNKLWAQVSPTISTAGTGQVMTDDAMTSIQDYIDNPNSDPARVAEARKAIAVNQETTLLYSMSAADRRERIVTLQREPIATDEQRAIRDAVIRISNQIDNAISNDPYYAYQVYGGGSMPEQSLAEAHANGELGAALQAQMDLKADVSAWVGIDVPALSDANVVDLMQIGPTAYPEILKVWGKDEAVKTLSEVYKKGAKEMAFAGAIALQHDGEQAWMHYLNGVSLTNDEKGNAYAPVGKDGAHNANTILNEMVSGAFPANGNFLNGKQAVADKIYASLSEQAQDRSGEFNKERYQEAVRLALGGLITINDSKIVPPNRSMTTESFMNRIESLTLDDISAMGGFQGMTKTINKVTGRDTYQTELVVPPEEVLDKIQSGDVEFKMTNMRGKYKLVINGMGIKNEAGEPFVLDLSQE
jgi:hypothetical protein